MNLLDNLKCPSSGKTFCCPVVFDCGHTLEKYSIQDFKYCPICKKKNLSRNRINWKLVELLNLDMQNIPKNFNYKILSAEDARKLEIEKYDKLAEKYIEDNIMPKIYDIINDCKDSFLRIKLDKNNDKIVFYNAVKRVLKKYDYNIEKSDDNDKILYISWGNDF